MDKETGTGNGKLSGMDKKIKFINEAHRENYEKAMQANRDRKLPLDWDKTMKELARNSKDHPTK